MSDQIARAFMSDVQRLMASPTAAACADVARRLDALSPGTLPWPEVRLGILASFTIDPLAPHVVAHGAASGIAIRTHVSGGDQWVQEVLNPASRLRAFAPDVIVVALELEDLSPALVHDYLGLDRAAVESERAQVVQRVSEVLTGVRAWSSAKMLVHAFPPPASRALGILDDRHPRGRRHVIRRLNTEIEQLATTLGDVFVLDIDALVASVGHAGWRDSRMWALARMPHTVAAQTALASEYLRYLRAFTGRVRKVLATDLDGTLWGGIVGEDGANGVQLGEGYKGRAFVQVQRALKHLSHRGVLLVINSKNNLDDALEVIESHPAMVLRRDDFAAMRVNWHDKASNLVELADELGLSLESFVFMDDNAAECERVRQALPEVLTLHLSGEPSSWADRLSDLGVFDSLSFGDEDRSRTAMYKSEAERRDLQRTLGSVDEFLASLEMQLDIEPIGPRTLPRAAELTQRTNQFNLTTRRFTEDALRDYLRHPEHEGFVFRLEDRFGDHGVIGVALTERQGPTLTVSTLLLSCRVLERTVEDSVVAFLVEMARESGAAVVEGLFQPSRKNAVSASLYERRGFTRGVGESDGLQRFTIGANASVPASPWITLRRVEPHRA